MKNRHLGFSLALALFVLILPHSVGWASYPIEQADFLSRLERSALRVQLDFDRQGKVYALKILKDTRKDDKIKDQVLSVDKAKKRLTLAALGVVDLSRATKLKLRQQKGKVAVEAWLDELSRMLEAGEPVHVNAKGRFEKSLFSARKIKTTKPKLTKVKARIGISDYDKEKGFLSFGQVKLSLEGTRFELKSK